VIEDICCKTLQLAMFVIYSVHSLLLILLQKESIFNYQWCCICSSSTTLHTKFIFW